MIDMSNTGGWIVMPGSRRLPTRGELRTWREFIETTEALRTVLAARLHSDTGLSPGDYAVLLPLSEECPTDSRGAEGVLEPAGAEAFREATVPHLRAIRELFVDALTADQLAA